MSDDEGDVSVQRRARFHERAPAYLNMLFAVVFSLTHDRELAHEIGQQTIVKYLSRMERENWKLEIKNEGAYLVQIAKNLVRDGWEDDSKAEFMSLDQQLDDRLLKVLSEVVYTPDIEKQLYFEELLREMHSKNILGCLTPDQRKLFLLHVEGLSNEEIGQEVIKETSVVRYELQKINYKLRTKVRQIYGKKGLFKSDT